MATGRQVQKLQEFLAKALEQEGDAYQGGVEVSRRDDSPEAFDASELVQWASAQAGARLPDGTIAQYRALHRARTTMDVDDALETPGALLFSFSSSPTGRGRPSEMHVAISLGDGRVLEASPDGGVRVAEAGDRFNYAGQNPAFGNAASSPEIATFMGNVLPPEPPPVDPNRAESLLAEAAELEQNAELLHGASRREFREDYTETHLETDRLEREVVGLRARARDAADEAAREAANLAADLSPADLRRQAADAQARGDDRAAEELLERAAGREDYVPLVRRIVDDATQEAARLNAEADAVEARLRPLDQAEEEAFARSRDLERSADALEDRARLLREAADRYQQAEEAAAALEAGQYPDSLPLTPHQVRINQGVVRQSVAKAEELAGQARAVPVNEALVSQELGALTPTPAQPEDPAGLSAPAPTSASPIPVLTDSFDELADDAALSADNPEGLRAAASQYEDQARATTTWAQRQYDTEYAPRVLERQQIAREETGARMRQNRGVEDAATAERVIARAEAELGYRQRRYEDAVARGDRSDAEQWRQGVEAADADIRHHRLTAEQAREDSELSDTHGDELEARREAIDVDAPFARYEALTAAGDRLEDKARLLREAADLQDAARAGGQALEEARSYASPEEIRVLEWQATQQAERAQQLLDEASGIAVDPAIIAEAEAEAVPRASSEVHEDVLGDVSTYTQSIDRSVESLQVPSTGGAEALSTGDPTPPAGPTGAEEDLSASAQPEILLPEVEAPEAVGFVDPTPTPDSEAADTPTTPAYESDDTIV